jgi:alpha-L-rhamnosidase
VKLKLFVSVTLVMICSYLSSQPKVVNDPSHYTYQKEVQKDWKAVWIGPDAAYPNTFWRYRKDFQLPKKPRKALTKIATDSKYFLWVNDSLIVFDGQLKRGPSPEDTYFDEIDLAPYLKGGKNTVAILSWYWGKDGFCHKNSGKAGLLFEAEIEKISLISDGSWMLKQDLAYQNSLPPYPNFRLPEHNVRYDARQMSEAFWWKTSYIPKWSKAQEIGVSGSAPYNKLWKRPIPMWYDTGLKAYKSIKVDSLGKYVATLGNNLTVSPYFKIKAKAGQFIDIRTDNYFGGSEPNVRTEYITKDGVQSFESPAYFNGHEVIYTFPKGVEVLEMKYRETRYNTDYVSTFECNDEFYNILRSKSANTLNVNMRDGIQDPDRERAQWWGDVVIILEEIFYTTDSRGILSIQKAISNLVEWQRKDSVLFSPIPAGNWNVELSAQMLASIGEYGIGKYIEYTGDTGIIRQIYPQINKYMGLWKLGGDGLVIHRPGGWDWHDWGSRIDVKVLDNAWYYLALKTYLKMAKHLGLNSDAQSIITKIKSIEDNFSKVLWKGNRFVSDDFAYFADDRAQGMAVCAGLCTPEQWKLLKPHLDTIYQAGPYLEKYILESYFIMGDAMDGQKRMKKRYQTMVDHPTIKTLWEGWEIGSATFGGGTYNHGWTGGPLSIMSKYMAGIAPTSLAYQSYQIKPQLGELQEVNAKVLTKKGWITMDLIMNCDKLTMVVETIDAAGIISVPKINDKSTIVRVPSDLVMISIDENYWHFETKKAHRYNFEVSLK